MPLAYAINQIKRRDAKSVPAKTMFVCPDDEFERLKGIGAVRKPTSDEAAAFEAEQDRLNGGHILRREAAEKAAAAEAVRLKAEKAAEQEDTRIAAEEAAEAKAKADAEAAEQEAAEAKAKGKKGGKKPAPVVNTDEDI